MHWKGDFLKLIFRILLAHYLFSKPEQCFRSITDLNGRKCYIVLPLNHCRSSQQKNKHTIRLIRALTDIKNASKKVLIGYLGKLSQISPSLKITMNDGTTLQKKQCHVVQRFIPLILYFLPRKTSLLKKVSASEKCT